MKKGFYYIKETSNKYKIKLFLTSVIVFIIILGSLIAFTNTFLKPTSDFPALDSVKQTLFNEIKSFSPAGLFYTGIIGGLFFIPLPQEAFFYYGLSKGNPLFLSLLTINSGYLIAQGINYFIGLKFNKYFFYFVSKRKLYKARRFINKHGGKGVFLFNLFPLPAPLLTFSLGIAKYNLYRLSFYILLGVAFKYFLIILLFLLVN